MSIIPTVIKKPENTQVQIGNNDERRMLSGISEKVEELKEQNLENAKFLRGISRKIETELEKLREFETGSVMSEDDDNLELAEKLDHIDGMVEGIDDSVKKLNADNILSKIDSINTSLSEFNPDVILIELDKLGNSIRNENSGDVKRELERISAGISGLDTDSLMKELNRMEALITEINSNAVLAELDHLREFISANNPDAAVKRIETKVDSLMVDTPEVQDYSESLNAIKKMLEDNAVQIESMQSKLDRIATMPVMVKSIIQSESEKNRKEMDNHMSEYGQQQIKKIDGLKTIIGFNLWLSLLAVVLIIVNVLGIL